MSDIPSIPNPQLFQNEPASIQCVLDVAQYYQLPANALLAIISNESGKNGHAVLNTNGTYDLGHMQINTATYNSEIAPMGIAMQDIQWKGCLNIYAAAYLVKKRLNENLQQDFWTRLANYHSKTPFYNARYKQKIIILADQWALWLRNNYQVNYLYAH
jgi:soluble lytic murein transglycosylase-like protein